MLVRFPEIRVNILLGVSLFGLLELIELGSCSFAGNKFVLARLGIGGYTGQSAPNERLFLDTILTNVRKSRQFLEDT